MPNLNTPKALKELLKARATAHGFSYCGVAAAEKLEDEAPRLEKWLSQQLHGEMAYMANHFDKRLDPTLLVPGAKSVVSLLFNYYTTQKQEDPGAPKISMYAYGEDYHLVIKEKLKALVAEVAETAGSFQARVFVDSAPVLEKAWAVKSGNGWQGKNTNVIHPKAGSWFFLAEIICDLDLEPDGPIKDYCGSCTACLDACPTNALFEPYQIDAQRCISYLTIELRSEIPTHFSDSMQNWAFGCDICQQVCPWNRFAKPHNEPRFLPASDWLERSTADWYEMTADIFQKDFARSAVQRTKWEGFQRNLLFLQRSSNTE